MIFKHFRYFQSFKSVPKKSAENHAPYMKVQKWKETWDHLVPIIMAKCEGQNLVILWNFQLFKHDFLSRCSTLQARFKLSKWVTFHDFQTFSTFSEFQKRAEKIGRKPCPLYEGSKWKEKWDHLVPIWSNKQTGGRIHREFGPISWILCDFFHLFQRVVFGFYLIFFKQKTFFLDFFLARALVDPG